MAKRGNKKAEAEVRALEIARRLKAIKPPLLTERQWCIHAGVSASFFSNLRGTPQKPPSEPTVGNLRSILQVVNSSLAEFFAYEAGGSVAIQPSARELEQALSEALPDLPSRKDKHAQFLGEVVARLLELRTDQLSIQKAAND